MLDWFKPGSGPGSNTGIFEYYRMLAEELAGQGRDPQAPAGAVIV